MGSIEGPEPSFDYPPYFTTTLGQAEYLNAQSPKKAVNEDTVTAFIDSRAKHFPQVPVLGEFRPPKSSSENKDVWNWRTYSTATLLSELYSLL